MAFAPSHGAHAAPDIRRAPAAPAAAATTTTMHMPSDSLSAGGTKTPPEEHSMRVLAPELAPVDRSPVDPSPRAGLGDDKDSYTLHPPRPPSLGYDWRARRLSFGLNIFALLFFNAILPNIILYVLLYHGDTDNIARGDNSILYGATTATLGTLQIPQWFWRWWECHVKNGSFKLTRHEAGEGWWRRVRVRMRRSVECWDLFQWAFLGGILTGATTLILGTCLDGNYGNWPLMALSPPIIFAFIGLTFALFNTASALAWRTPRWLRIPGHEPHALVRPGLAYVWPDLTAVDGGGRQAFRTAFEARWTASPPFRHMVAVLSWAVAVPLVLILGPEIALVVVIKNTTPDFVTSVAHSWAPVWALLLFTLLAQTAFSVFYVRASFRRELAWWSSSNAHGK